jgi:serine/threonine protein kinase
LEHGRPSDLSILTRLAVGGMAEIFLARRGAREGVGGELVVVKRILPQYAEEGRFLRMLFDEATISMQLQHPNIVKVHGLSRGGEQGYSLIMEYVPGETVARLMRAVRAAKKTIPAPFCAYVAEQAAGALHYAHGLTDGRGVHLGLVHRDITPGNIMLSDTGAVKVLDFGIARAHGRFDKTASSDIRKGTLGYMSPEYYRNGHLDRRADIFSLGVVLFEMLTMTHPFDAPNEMAMVQKILRGETHDLRKLLPAVHPKLVAAVEGAMVLDPEKRYQNGQELQKALHEYLATLKSAPGRDDIAQMQREYFAAQIEARQKLMSTPAPAPGAATQAPPAPPAPPPVSERVSRPGPASDSRDWSNVPVVRPLSDAGAPSDEAPTNVAENQNTAERHYVPDLDESYEDATVVTDSSGVSNLSFLNLNQSGKQTFTSEKETQRLRSSFSPVDSMGTSQKIVIEDESLTGQALGASSSAPGTQTRKSSPPKRRKSKHKDIIMAVVVGSVVLVLGVVVLLLLKR